MRLPDNYENSLLLGAVTNPEPGNHWIILLFDGTRISAISYRYSRVWGLYITGTVKDEELKVIEKINQLNPDTKKLKQFVDFGNCPPLNIAFEDWVQSAAETANKIINLLVPSKKCPVIILSSHPSWAGKIRMTRLYKRMGINPDTAPDRHLAAEVAKKGLKKISDGYVSRRAAVDQNYFIHVIKRKDKKSGITKKCIFQEGKPLESIQNSDKNRSLPLIFTPFSKETRHYDLILTKSKGNKSFLVCIYRVKTEEKPLKLYAGFEPWHDIPTLIIPGIKDFEMMKGVTSVSSIRIGRDQKPLQVMALIDATMPENLLEAAKAKLIEVFGSVSRENTAAEFGLVVYGDYSEGSYRESDFEVKHLPIRFLAITEWIKTCEKDLTRVKPVDFMAALDKGLRRVTLFPWKDDAQKYLLLIFCHPPHPQKNPGRDIYKSPFTPAENDWFTLLRHLHEKKNIELFALTQQKDIKGEKAAEIKQEIDITCQVMKKVGFTAQGIKPIDEIGFSMIKQTVGDYRIEPDTYQIPIILEEKK